MQHRVNWWAIVVSAVAFFLFGWLWYDVLFGRAWIVALGMTQPQMVEAAHGNIAYPFVLSFVMALGLSYGVARVLSWLPEVTPLRGAFVAFSMGLLIFGTMTWMDYTYEMRNPVLRSSRLATWRSAWRSSD